MGETYKAWNGQDYPSPPPKGWYKASDQTWWPEGTGPGPEKSLTADAPTRIPSTQKPIPTKSPESTPAAEPTSKLPAVSSQPTTPGSTTPTVASTPNQFNTQPQSTTPQTGSSNPAGSTPGVAQPNQRAQQFGQQPANRPAQQFGAQASPQGQGFGQQPAQQFGAQASPQGQGFGQQPAQQFGAQANPQGRQVGQNWSQGQQQKSGGSKGLIIGVAALAAFGLVAIVVLAVVVNSPDDSNQAGPVASTAEPATTVATTVPPTTAAPTTAEPTTTTVDPDVAVEELRDHLNLIGIDSSEVSDSAIELTAILTCGQARRTDSPAEWAEVRETEVETSIESQREAGVDPLSEQQWSQFIDARLVFFCPEEAERLGVTL